MRATRFSSVVIGVAVVLGALAVAPLWAQTLADVARKEEERRKQLPQGGKVYTNKDLGAVPPPSTPTPPPSGSADASGAPAVDKPKEGDKSGQPASGNGAAAADKGAAKSQEYWASKKKSIADQIDRDSTYAEALQSRINALTTDFVNRDDPAQRTVVAQNRDKALAELARLKKAIEAGKKSLADLEEEARRAGVPPGWLR